MTSRIINSVATTLDGLIEPATDTQAKQENER
jgi:hypothetical protein